MAAPYSYDSKDVVLLISGLLISGFGDNKVTITRTNDVTNLMEGVDGENMYSRSNKTSGELSFDLIYGCDSDLFMDALVYFDGFVQITFAHGKALKGLATFGRVKTQADITLGETPEFRTWTMHLDDVTFESLSELLPTSYSPTGV